MPSLYDRIVKGWANVVPPRETYETEKDRYLKRQYGITLRQYRTLLDHQGCACRICGKPEDDTYGKWLAVDHDHQHGHVRGLLCNGCNSVLGHAGDSIETLQRAIDYLKASERLVTMIHKVKPITNKQRNR
ncbi:MAG: endonuclease VII domain-containing protein [Nitrospira sp.]|nr:endonuclease VII domain-containing protein [Nitrospira sp.]